MAQQTADLSSGNGDAKVVSFSAMAPQLLFNYPKAADAISFYKAAFSAVEVNRVLHPKRKAEQDLPFILSSRLKIGSSVLLVSDVSDDSASPTEKTLTGCMLCVEAENVTAAVDMAVAAGGSQVGEIAEEEAPLGGRHGKVKDPFGFTWVIRTPGNENVEDEAKADA